MHPLQLILRSGRFFSKSGVDSSASKRQGCRAASPAGGPLTGIVGAISLHPYTLLLR
jgi:hypothetical protein